MQLDPPAGDGSPAEPAAGAAAPLKIKISTCNKQCRGAQAALASSLREAQEENHKNGQLCLSLQKENVDLKEEIEATVATLARADSNNTALTGENAALTQQVRELEQKLVASEQKGQGYLERAVTSESLLSEVHRLSGRDSAGAGSSRQVGPGSSRQAEPGSSRQEPHPKRQRSEQRPPSGQALVLKAGVVRNLAGASVYRSLRQKELCAPTGQCHFCYEQGHKTRECTSTQPAPSGDPPKPPPRR